MTLTIEPGVVVKLNPSRQITINGALHAQGTLTEPVVFTSYRDDSYGGDTNGDGNLTYPAPGDWYRVRFTAGADTVHSKLDYCRFYYGGTYYRMLDFETSPMTITNSVLSYSNSDGIIMNNAAASIIDCEISHNVDDGIDVYNTKATGLIQGNTISDNNRGIYVRYNGAPNIQSNQITNNTTYGIFSESYSTNFKPIDGNTITGNNIPVRIPFSSLPSEGDTNIFSPNTINVVEIINNALSESKRLKIYQGATRSSSLYVYAFQGSTFNIPSGTVLTVDPGVIVKMQGSYLRVNGEIGRAVGRERV